MKLVPLIRLLFLLLPMSRPSGGAEPFSFLTPWDDATPDIVDVSNLNDGAAGSHGFIVVRDGHFAESDTGRRVRFLGTNLGLDSLFPSHEDAEKLAAHLAKYGINAVRFHHEDATWAGQDCLWDPRYRDHRHIDAAQLDKMDYLAAQLEKRGIYIDMCLHVSRKFTAANGFPPTVSQIPFPFDKRVDIFDPQMISTDKEYFRDLLTHRNPYTGRTYAADPGVLDVEINNENSLMGLYGDNPGANLSGPPAAWSGLPPPYDKELFSLWNRWLAKKYGITANLAAAWKMRDQTTGPNLYPPSDDPSKWTLETQTSTSASMAREDGSLRVNVYKTDGTGWHVQLYQRVHGLLEDGATYTLTMEMKSDKERDQELSSHLDKPDYPNLGIEGIVHLTPRWETYTFWFKAQNAGDGQCRLPSLALGTQTGSTWIRNITLKPGIGPDTLPASQTLERGTVPIDPPGWFRARADWLSFLADTEADYVRSMRAYLRDDLKVKPLIICSQTSFGGLWGNYRERASDFADHHGYWDYHNVFAEPITNQPMIRSLGHDDPLTLIARERTAGQPTSVTEYNSCFPNEYRAKMLPGYASFAAFQDWDAIFLFTHVTYGSRGARSGVNDMIQVPLEASVDPAIWGFMPSAALIFRAGLVPIAPAVQTLGLPAQFPAEQVAAGLSPIKAWDQAGAPPLAPFTRRMQLGIGLPDASPDSAAPVGALHVQTAVPAAACYIADAPAAKVVFGFVGGQSISLTGVNITFGELTNNFGAFTLTTMDGKPVAQSSRILLTMVTHTQNKGQIWNAARTVLTHPGSGPPQVYPAAADISVTTDSPRAVFTLDGSGEKLSPIPSTYKNGQVTFSITAEQKSIWFAITRP